MFFNTFGAIRVAHCALRGLIKSALLR
jgi:hypothetical protein